MNIFNSDFRFFFLLLAFIICLSIIVWIANFIFSPERKLWKHPWFMMILFGLFGLPITGSFGSRSISIFRHNYQASIGEAAIYKGDILAWIIWISLFSLWLWFIYTVIFKQKK